MFKKRLLTLISSLIIVATLFTVQGNLVLADTVTSSVEQTVTMEDLIKMSDKELAAVPQVMLTAALNSFYEMGEKEWCKYDEKDIQRIADQFEANAQVLILEKIAEKVPVPTKSININVGDSFTTYSADDGDSGASGWGGWGWYAYYNGTRIGSYAQIIGIGESISWARSGFVINVGGSGSAFYRIDMACGWGLSVVDGQGELSLLVEEWRDGGYSSFSLPIDSYSSLLGNHDDYFDPYSSPTYVRLYAGGLYRVSLKVQTSCSTNWIGTAGADCYYSPCGAGWNSLHLQYIP